MSDTSPTFLGTAYGDDSYANGVFTAQFEYSNFSYYIVDDNPSATVISVGDPVALYETTSARPESATYLGYYLDGTTEYPLVDYNGDDFLLGQTATTQYDILQLPYTQGEVTCFCRGTMILTERGEVAVQNLAVGDAVLTRSGAARPLTWIGRGRSLVTPANPNARPIIVRQGALADGVPTRDLYLTRGHSLLLDDVLIPVEYLVNDRSIAWDTAARVVEFYHLELEHHDVLLAEGAPAESYREDGNRQLFHNTDAPPHARADLASYAPVLTGGPEVDRVWARLVARAGGGETELTEDADPHLLADGARVDGEANGLVHRFRLARTPFELRLRSRVCNPTRLGMVRDPRNLGLAVRRLVLRGEGVELALGWDSPWFEEGFNNPEPAERIRWTTGDALVPGRALAAFDGAVEVELELGMTTRYPANAGVSAADTIAAPRDLSVA